MRKRTLLIAAILSVCFAGAALAADITGSWTGTLSMGDNQINLTYSFKQDGEKLTGTVVHEGGNEPVAINGGKVQGDKVTFYVEAERGGTLTKYIMEGAIKGDEITLSMKAEGGPELGAGPMTLKRVK